VRCWSHRHTTSVAQEGGMTMGSTWAGGGKRRRAGSIVGLSRLYTCTPGRSGAVSHRLEQLMCPQSVTREPASSWIARTSQQCAFQQEVARSDLSGTHRNKAGSTWQRAAPSREVKRGHQRPSPPVFAPGISVPKMREREL